MQVNYDIGALLACFTTSHGDSYCIVRPLQYMDILGERICNEYDCPILNLTGVIYCLPSRYILSAVSIVHECTTTCTFVISTTQKKIEHEVITVSKTTYRHDWSNKLYCENIYCME